MNAALRSVLLVNRGGLVGSFAIVVLAAALLTATGTWLQAGWSAEPSDGLALLPALASSFAGTTVIITVFLVASSFATALRRRRREFALLRSVGATAAQVRGQVVSEVLVVVALGAPAGAVLGVLIAPLLTPLLVANRIIPADFSVPVSPLAALAAIVMITAASVAAGRLAARESAKLSPVEAVRQSSAEPAVISAGRRIAAVITALAGVLVALTPLFSPGLLGAVAGSSSVLLLIVASALGGPVIVGWLAARAAEVPSGRAETALAVLNMRGFSRRSTAVILPLALLLCLGAVQSGVSVASARATGVQLEKALTADLVVSAPSGAVADEAEIAGLPGVEQTARLGAIQASVRVDDPDEDLPGLDALSWEATSIRSITPADAGLLDPGVVDGDLSALAGTGTIAVSRDALAFTGKGIGDTIGLRAGGEDATVRIVAIYDNALGVGDYLTSTTGAESPQGEQGVLLVRTAPQSQDVVRDALRAAGLAVTDAHGFAEEARAVSGAEQGLSTVLLLALLAFIAVAALQTLATATAGRRAEFELLRRTGATRSQILAMVAVESAFIVGAALLLAAAAALPALLSFGIGVLGDPLAAFDPVITAALAGAVIALPVVTTLGVAAGQTAPRGAATAARQG